MRLHRQHRLAVTQHGSARLTPCEFAIAAALAATPERTVPRAEILAAWPRQPAPAGSLRTTAHTLREKLRPLGVEIETVLGRGLRLVGRNA
jgi:DNA-binding response OmpR family regulator